MSHLKGFFKKITGDTNSYDELAKKPIVDAEIQLNLFRDATATSLAALEAYGKLMNKQADPALMDKFAECQDIFNKFEAKGDSLNPALSHVMGIVFGKLFEAQKAMCEEVADFVKNLFVNVLKPLEQYQKEVTVVKENRKDLKDAYDKIEQCRQTLDKAKKDVENAQRIASSYSSSQQGRISLMPSDPNKRTNDISRLEEKVQRLEKELDEATSVANEKYDKYTEGLYRRVADECELTSKYLDYLKMQKKYHKQACKRLEKLIPEVKSSLECYTKKPVFGCPLGEYVYLSSPNLRSPNVDPDKPHLSPVIRKLIESMRAQKAFDEEGLFRIAGSRIKMNCLIGAINAGYIDHLDTDNDYDVHCLASVLKQYLRELPDSILCNDLYDDWIAAIGKSPLPKKIEAFKEVLKKLPKTNYDNLRYLIVFLAQVVENSERTKMTSQNMSICFGVSLLSSNAALNGSGNSSIVLSPPSSTVSNTISSAGSPMASETASMGSGKSIDMATATNVFDFILNNYKELFWSAGSSANVNGSSVYSNGSGGGSSHQQSRSNLNNSTASLNLISSRQHAFEHTNPGFHLRDNHSDSPHSNRYSVMIVDNSAGGGGGESLSAVYPKAGVGFQATAVSHAQPLPSPSSLSSSTSTSTLTTSNSNITNLNRHIKKSSLDSRFVDSITDLTASNTSLSSTKASSQPKQDDSNSSSTSPRLRPKKQAPAPPPVTSRTTSETHNTASNYSSPDQADSSAKSSSTNHHHSAIITIAPTGFSKLSNEFSQLSTSSLVSEKPLEKPNQPPPTVPNRPPPIGFNVSLFAADTTSADSLPYPSTSPSSSIYIVQPSNTSITESSDSVHSPTSVSSGSGNGAAYKLTNGFNGGVDSGHSSQVSSSSAPASAAIPNGMLLTSNVTNVNNASSSSFLSTSISSTSSSSQEVLNSPNNTLVKPPKPAVPPKRGTMVAAHISKLESKSSSNGYDYSLADRDDEQPNLSPKTPSEITSL